MNDRDFTRWIQALDTGAPPPDPEVIWWRAELRRRLADEDRVTRPVRLAERFACAACVMAAAVLGAVITWGKF